MELGAHLFVGHWGLLSTAAAALVGGGRREVWAEDRDTPRPPV